MSSHKRRRTATGQGGGARRPAATQAGQSGQAGPSSQRASATKTGAAVASRPVTRSTTAGGGATVRRASVHPENYRSRMNRHLRARRQRNQILGTAAAVIVVGLVAWLLFTHLPHNANTAKTKSPAAAVTGPQATLTAAAQAPAACVTPKVPGLNGTGTNSGGPPAIKGTVQTGGQCLQWVDIKEGTGAAIKAGDTVSVQYTGWLLDGQKFDSSYDHGGTPFQVQNVGNAQVIQGWNMGLVGMKLNGERELIIPAALGYGAAGSPPAIPANATLIFTITVVSIP